MLVGGILVVLYSSRSSRREHHHELRVKDTDDLPGSVQSLVQL